MTSSAQTDADSGVPHQLSQDGPGAISTGCDKVFVAQSCAIASETLFVMVTTYLSWMQSLLLARTSEHIRVAIAGESFD